MYSLELNGGGYAAAKRDADREQHADDHSDTVQYIASNCHTDPVLHTDPNGDEHADAGDADEHANAGDTDAYADPASAHQHAGTGDGDADIRANSNSNATAMGIGRIY